jgi:hypothetical protein
MDELFRFIPVITVAVVAANVVILWRRAGRLSALTPERATGYYGIVRAFALYFGAMTILWTAGAMFGIFRVVGMPREDSVMRDLGPTTFDWLFMLAWALVVVRFSVWLYARGGAEFLVDHGEIFNSFPSNAGVLKVLWAVLLLVSSASAIHQFRS